MTSPVDLTPLLPDEAERASRRDALVAELDDRARRRDACRRPPRRTGRRLVPAVVVLTLLVVAAPLGLGAMLGTAGLGSGPVDVVAAARAAAVPSRDSILHVVMRLDQGPPRTPAVPRGSRRRASGRESIGTVTGRIERWSTTDPPRDRTAWSVRLPGRSTPGTLELSYADGVFRERESWRGHTRVRRAAAIERAGYEQDRGRADRSWLQNATFSSDPVAGIRRLLGSGRLRDDGRERVGGRLVHRLVGTEPGTVANGSAGGAIAYEYLVDDRSFAPVRVTVTRVLPARPTSALPALRTPRRFVQRWSFETYERLPLTRRTASLLTVGAR